jgi:hypothetical protein
MTESTWTAPVLEELSVPAGTLGGSGDDLNNADGDGALS